MYCQVHKTTFEEHECPLCTEPEEELGIYPLRKTQYCPYCKAEMIEDIFLGESYCNCEPTAAIAREVAAWSSDSSTDVQRY